MHALFHFIFVYTAPVDPGSDGEFTCTDKEDGLYPDPNDCSNFYACSNNGQTKLLTSCYTGLVFNPYCTCCDFPDNYNCQGVSDFSCLGKDDGLYPDEEDCRAYFSCSGGAVTGRTICVEGLAYNPNCLCCDWPQNYQCPTVGPGSSDGPSSTSALPTSNGLGSTNALSTSNTLFFQNFGRNN